ncbi:MAG: hypothetical protein U5Q03_06355 [Bacteroidota bacterium]|nr:hypothetical protein [Bacteroidota bacterium]
MLKLKAGKIKKHASVEIPCSKSISTRLLMLHALSDGLVSYEELSEADDAVRLKRALYWIGHCNKSGIPMVIDAGNSGAVMRFLVAYLCLVPGTWMITGSDRLKERPVKELVEALRSLGADIAYAGEEEKCPLLIRGGKLKGGEVDVDLSRSSQFASAILMIAPETTEGISMRFSAGLPSMSYLDMTVKMLEHAGVGIEKRRNGFRIEAASYRNVLIPCEKDWSAAAFWYESLLVSGMESILIKGLQGSELQGDALLPALFEGMGVKSEFLEEGLKISRKASKIQKLHIDLSQNIDLALPLILGCSLNKQEAKFTGLANLKYKESDRLEALHEYLDNMQIDYHSDHKTFVELKTSEPQNPGVFNCRNDHRLIMSLAPLALFFGEIELKNHEEVEKSYPDFWEEIVKTGIELI